MVRPVLAVLPLLLALPAPASAQGLEAPAREHEPVVLSGAQLGTWAAPAEVAARAPGGDVRECPPSPEPEDFEDPLEGGASGAAAPLRQDCPDGVDPHNAPRDPDVTTAGATPAGTPVERLAAFRWDGHKLKPVPVQVDERFTRWLNNTASGFAPYSGEDQHLTYAFDREGFRWTASDPANPCLARPASPVAQDPVAGLDANDEVVFMARDASLRAPAGTPPPKDADALREVLVADPAGGPDRFVYLARTTKPVEPGAPYVRYERDAVADTFERSESSYENYGNARVGPYCDAQGNVVGEGRRRPRDYATVTTPRYRFRYDGRWLMTEIGISARDDWSYGPDLVDRWKARAFAQDPGSETPCCGFEEEDTNWGGSSTLLGEKAGPVRVIRETWGADSGTNVVRRETFYRDVVDQRTFLRVHPIPPLDGIYAQWDFNAGRVTTFYNSRRPDGVTIDGRNDEVFGNLDDPCNRRYDAQDPDAPPTLDQRYRSIFRATRTCDWSPYHQSVDLADPTFGEANAALGWSQVSGPHGTIVDRLSASATELSPGGAAQSLAAVPYYRDDSCFDDGTGTDPGPKVKLRSGDEPRTAADGTPRRCWAPEDGVPDGSDRFFQGSIATHGVHLLLVGESDNARATVPTTEIVNDWRMVLLPGDRRNVGERYGRSFERPLRAVVLPAQG